MEEKVIGTNSPSVSIQKTQEVLCLFHIVHKVHQSRFEVKDPNFPLCSWKIGGNNNLVPPVLPLSTFVSLPNVKQWCLKSVYISTFSYLGYVGIYGLVLIKL